MIEQERDVAALVDAHTHPHRLPHKQRGIQPEETHDIPKHQSNAAELFRDFTVVFYLIFVFAQYLPNFAGFASNISGDQTSEENGSTLNQIILILSAFSALISVITLKVPTKIILKSTVPLFLPVVLILLSIAWSDYPLIATRRSIRFLIELFTLILLASTYKKADRFLFVLWMTAVIVLFLDLAMLMAPSISFSPIGYKGIHNHKNQLGSMAYAFLPIFAGALLKKSNFIILFLNFVSIILLTFLLVISLSKTPMAVISASVMCTLYALLICRADLANRIFAYFATLVLSCIVAIIIAEYNWSQILEIIFGDPTLTGRDQIWSYTIQRVAESPIVGFGYGSFWGVGPAEDLMKSHGITFAFAQAHNGYIDILAQLGAVGIVVVFITFIYFIKEIINLLKKANRKDEILLSMLAFYVLFGILLYNVTESSFLRAGFDTWVYFILVTQTAMKIASRTKGREGFTRLTLGWVRHRCSGRRRTAPWSPRPSRPSRRRRRSDA